MECETREETARNGEMCARTARGACVVVVSEVYGERRTRSCESACSEQKRARVIEDRGCARGAAGPYNIVEI